MRRAFIVVPLLALASIQCMDDDEIPGECGELDPEIAEFRSTLPLILIDPQGHHGLDDVDERPWVDIGFTLVDVRDGDGTAGLTDEPQYAGTAAIHIRGNSSAEEYPKKQYTLELRDEAGEDIDVSLLGMPAEEDWVLHAPYSDKTFQRNVLMYELSNSIGRYAARTRFVEAFICKNRGSIGWDDHQGVYVLMEKLKRDSARIDVEKLGPADDQDPEITGGYVLRRDWLPEDGEDAHTWFTTTYYNDDLLFEYPKPSEISEAQRDYITGYVDEFELALTSGQFTDPELGYSHWIDVDSFIDYHLLIELGRSVDGYVLSTWLVKPRGGRLAMGPIWDFNGALGNADYFDAWETEGWHYENPGFPEDNPNGYRWFERLFQDPAFRARYRERWQQHRAGPWTDEAIIARIRANAAMLEQPAKRNFERWPILGEYVWPNDEGAEDRDTYADEVAYLEAWILERLAWMDSELS